VWRQEESGRVRTPLEPFVLAATIALIPVLILEADATGGWQTVAYVANWLIWGVFAAELAAILFFATRKKAALRAHWLDAAIVLLTVPWFGELLSSLRLVRFARLLRLLRVGVVIGRAVQAQRRLGSGAVLRVVALATVFIVVVAGAAQATVNTEEFGSIWDGIWWAIVTVTTVGYGDLYPVTVQGRIIGIFVMLLGIGFLSVLTATVATQFIKSDTGSDEVMETLRRIEADMADVKAQLLATGRLRRMTAERETPRGYLAAIEREIASGQSRLAAARERLGSDAPDRAEATAAIADVTLGMALRGARPAAGWRRVRRGSGATTPRHIEPAPSP
jgi:voltage-gated potassium channel